MDARWMLLRQVYTTLKFTCESPLFLKVVSVCVFVRYFVSSRDDRDVTERAQGYTLQGASFMRQSQCSFLNV